TAAPAYIQVQALHTTVLVIVGLIAAAFGLSLWAFLTERKNRAMAQPHPVEVPIQES
ncbi:MAG: hypothetical protein HGA53_05790, partial [Anaerolineaceae bacterium]|nr:hypothetical protein [Anaerolineaceae bacterium]